MTRHIPIAVAGAPPELHDTPSPERSIFSQVCVIGSHGEPPHSELVVQQPVIGALLHRPVATSHVSVVHAF